MAEGSVITEPAYVGRLVSALRERLSGAEVEYERIRRDRYRFEVIWEGFDGMGHPERQQIVWDLADEVLSKPEVLQVGMILTVGAGELS